MEVPRALRIGMGGEVERSRVEEGLGIVAVIGAEGRRNRGRAGEVHGRARW